MNSMYKSIVKYRRRIDGLSKNLKLEELPNDLKGIPNSTNDLIECEKSLLLAKAYLGKVLGTYDIESPYQNDGKRKTIKDIEPAADTGEPIKASNNSVEYIDTLREEIKELSEEVFRSLFLLNYNEALPHLVKRKIFWTESYKNLCEARFSLGFALQSIKEFYDG